MASGCPTRDAPSGLPSAETRSRFAASGARSMSIVNSHKKGHPGYPRFGGHSAGSGATACTCRNMPTWSARAYAASQKTHRRGVTLRSPAKRVRLAQQFEHVASAVADGIDADKANLILGGRTRAISG
eukprot:1297044-Prymnesium_polylepis.1